MNPYWREDNPDEGIGWDDEPEPRCATCNQTYCPTDCTESE